MALGVVGHGVRQRNYKGSSLPSADGEDGQGQVVIVLCDPWRAHLLAWIHRAEARSITAELRRTGRTVSLKAYGEKLNDLPPSGPPCYAFLIR